MGESNSNIEKREDTHSIFSVDCGANGGEMKHRRLALLRRRSCFHRSSRSQGGLPDADIVITRSSFTVARPCSTQTRFVQASNLTAAGS